MSSSSTGYTHHKYKIGDIVLCPNDYYGEDDGFVKAMSEYFVGEKLKVTYVLEQSTLSDKCVYDCELVNHDLYHKDHNGWGGFSFLEEWLVPISQAPKIVQQST